MSCACDVLAKRVGPKSHSEIHQHRLDSLPLEPKMLFVAGLFFRFAMDVETIAFALCESGSKTWKNHVRNWHYGNHRHLHRGTPVFGTQALAGACTQSRPRLRRLPTDGKRFAKPFERGRGDALLAAAAACHANAHRKTGRKSAGKRCANPVRPYTKSGRSLQHGSRLE